MCVFVCRLVSLLFCDCHTKDTFPVRVCMCVCSKQSKKQMSNNLVKRNCPLNCIIEFKHHHLQHSRAEPKPSDKKVNPKEHAQQNSTSEWRKDICCGSAGRHWVDPTTGQAKWPLQLKDFHPKTLPVEAVRRCFSVVRGMWRWHRVKCTCCC